jgi:hypothetical protein
MGSFRKFGQPVAHAVVSTKRGPPGRQSHSQQFMRDTGSEPPAPLMFILEAKLDLIRI